jgi:hypothetical protein
MTEAKPMLDASMESRIDSFLAFMAQEEMDAAIATDSSRNKFIAFEKAMAACEPKS